MTKPPRKFWNDTTAAFVGSAVSILFALFTFHGRFVEVETRVIGIEADVQLLKQSLIASEPEEHPHHFTALRPTPEDEQK